MVKGVSKRVVVVRPDDSRFFEQAFFIVREGRTASGDALREACALAARYHAKHPARPLPLRRYADGIVGTVWKWTDGCRVGGIMSGFLRHREFFLNFRGIAL